LRPARGATKGARASKAKEVGPAPTRAELHEAALSYLAKSAASADSVDRTLQRKISAWARRAARGGRDAEAVAADVETSRALVPLVIERLREVGLVNDRAFAAGRARSLSHGGRSGRAIRAHLAARGVAAETVREAVPNDRGAELDAALTFARKRRIGPYARDAEDREARQRALAAMARAGFDFDVCERALRMDRDDADERLRARSTF